MSEIANRIYESLPAFALLFWMGVPALVVVMLRRRQTMKHLHALELAHAQAQRFYDLADDLMNDQNVPRRLAALLTELAGMMSDKTRAEHFVTWFFSDRPTRKSALTPEIETFSREHPTLAADFGTAIQSGITAMIALACEGDAAKIAQLAGISPQESASRMARRPHDPASGDAGHFSDGHLLPA